MISVFSQSVEELIGQNFKFNPQLLETSYDQTYNPFQNLFDIELDHSSNSSEELDLYKTELCESFQANGYCRYVCWLTWVLFTTSYYYNIHIFCKLHPLKRM